MFKASLILALFSSSLYAQSLQDLANQASAAVGGLVNDLGGLQQTEDSVALNVNEYEWVLTSYDGELEFSISELPSNSNNLAPAITALLSGAGGAAQDNAGVVSATLGNPNPGIVVNDNGLASGAVADYSPQLQDNAESIANQVQDAYNQAAVALITNQNGARDKVNQQVNDAANGDQGANAATLNNLIGQAVASAPNNLVEVNADNVPALIGLALPIAEAADSTSGAVDANQAVDAYNNAAGEASASLNSLPSGVSNAVSSAASNAASAAANQFSDAANNVANQATNTLNSVGLDFNTLGNSIN